MFLPPCNISQQPQVKYVSADRYVFKKNTRIKARFAEDQECFKQCYVSTTILLVVGQTHSSGSLQWTTWFYSALTMQDHKHVSPDLDLFLLFIPSALKGNTRRCHAECAKNAHRFDSVQAWLSIQSNLMWKYIARGCVVWKRYNSLTKPKSTKLGGTEELPKCVQICYTEE